MTLKIQVGTILIEDRPLVTRDLDRAQQIEANNNGSN
jgi:hypothetical protein